ncbi:MAG: methyltransferase [Candidatus Eisenbacteria bacterium]
MAPVPKGVEAPPRRFLPGLGRFFYRYRSYTPLPLVAVVLAFSRPTPLSLAAGLALAGAGEGLRLAALRHIGGASRTRRLGDEGLVTGGPYGWTRNPLYAGNLLLSGGLAIATGLAWFPPLLLLLFAIQYGPIIISEEEELHRRHPEAYGAYAARAPRFFPRPPERSARPPRWSWREAARIERSTLLTVAFLTLALLLHYRLHPGGTP